jgi:hypothetical protein
MSKILDGEFRNTLYKNLVDAGYEKDEAQKIVGNKYYVSLKEDIKAKIDILSKDIEGEAFSVKITDEWVNDFNTAMAELNKMKKFLK